MKSSGTIQIQFDFGEEVATIEPPVKKLSFREEETFVFEFMDILTAPIITFSTSWADAIPNRLKQDIKIARLMGGMVKENFANIPEFCIDHDINVRFIMLICRYKIHYTNYQFLRSYKFFC